MENTIKQLKQMRFISDPSHGWLQVPLSTFLEMKATASPYSYVNKPFIYLEEDCDAPDFLEKFSEKNNISMKDIFRHIKETFLNEQCFIRTLPHWCGNI